MKKFRRLRGGTGVSLWKRSGTGRQIIAAGKLLQAFLLTAGKSASIKETIGDLSECVRIGNFAAGGGVSAYTEKTAAIYGVLYRNSSVTVFNHSIGSVSNQAAGPGAAGYRALSAAPLDRSGVFSVISQGSAQKAAGEGSNGIFDSTDFPGGGT